MSAKTFKPACFSAAEIQDWAIGVPAICYQLDDNIRQYSLTEVHRAPNT